MSEYLTPPPSETPNLEDLLREVAYLRRRSEQMLGYMMQLDSRVIAIRHELEQKRRGFALMAELYTTLGQTPDYDTVFVSVSRRISAALNMQRTTVLVPDGSGLFKASVLNGYPAVEEFRINAQSIALDEEFFNAQKPLLVTGESPESRFASVRNALNLPYFIASPVFLYNKVAAVLITGRTIEQMPWMPRLGKSDVETVQTVSAYLTAILAGRQLAEAEERTKIMLDATPLCCNFWDEQLRNIDCNEAAARLFGLSGKQEYLERFHELSPEFQPDGRRSSELAVEKVRAAFANGYARFEWMHQTPDGSPIPAEVTLIRVRRGTGHIVAGYTRDLREQKAMLAEMRRTQDELRLARDRAEESDRAKSRFLANMSHEIRTPLNAIVGMTHLLADSELNDWQRSIVNKAKHSSSLLLVVINDIFDFSKLDAGTMKIENKPVPLREIVSQAGNAEKVSATAKGLSLDLKIDPEVPDLIMGDARRLKQVLGNLLNNAVKFTTKGGVTLHVSRNTPDKEPSPDIVSLLFSISDTGIGMSEKQRELLFSPFTQVDDSMTRQYGGTGLGLAISKGLAEMMNGQIWCESAQGRGSTFFFAACFTLAGQNGAVEAALPHRAELFGDRKSHTRPLEQDLAPDADDSEQLKKLQGLRVLLVEDNEINRLIASELLSNKGVIVSTANNGLEALRALEKSSFDLVLMDIQMPEMDGLEAAARIRANPKCTGLPIIALTAHATPGDKAMSLSSGMNEHLTKPIDPDNLYSALIRWSKPTGSACSLG